MKANISFARKLRKNLTEAEKALWYVLQGRNIQGVKFRRQSPIGKYIVDFVCFEKKLVIEIDGSQHSDSPTDKLRDAWLEGQGFTVLRFWNNEVIENRPGVVLRIMNYLQHPPLTPPI